VWSGIIWFSEVSDEHSFQVHFRFMVPYIVVIYLNKTPTRCTCFKILKIYLHYSAVHVSDTIVSIIKSFSAAHAVSGPVWCLVRCVLQSCYVVTARFYVPISAWFIVPDGCYCPVQFLFGVLIFVDFTCLFGIGKFQVHGSVHRCNMNNMNILVS